MKILLTGATGYLGSNLVRRLLNDGHDVAAYRRHKSSLSRIVDVASYIDWYYSDEEDLAVPFKRHNGIDVVVHLATSYGRNGEPSATVFAANAAFPVRLLDVAIHYNTDTFYNADTILNPKTNQYALSKKLFAEWGEMVAEQSGIRFANIRLEHFYGPNDDPSKFTTHIIHQCLKNVPVIALTLGEQMRDFLFIDDAVEAFSTLLEKQQFLPRGYVDVGLGSGIAVTVRKFVETVHSLCNSTSELDFGALPYREHEIMLSDTDISLLGSLGWHPRLSLEEGLQRMIIRERANFNLETGA